MTKYINKSTLVNKIKKRIKETESMLPKFDQFWAGQISAFKGVLKILNTLEVKDHYEECIQYDSIQDGIKAHAETYSFNIESELFNQLTKEQQELWRKEIEQACISGGDAGVELARDPRYKENLEVKDNDVMEEMDFDDYSRFFKEHPDYSDGYWGFEETWEFAQYCYTLGLKAKNENKL